MQAKLKTKNKSQIVFWQPRNCSFSLAAEGWDERVNELPRSKLRGIRKD
jgi:hypothetical protein